MLLLVATEHGSSPTGPEPDSAADFRPQPIGPAGRSPALAVAVAAAALVVVALAKPWAAFEPTDPTVAGVSAPTTPQAIEATTAPTSPDRRLPRPGAVGRAIQPHDAWGVLLIVDAVPGDSTARGLLEHWLPATPAQPGSIPSVNDATDVRSLFTIAVDRLRLVGLTTPPGATVGDLRLIMARPLGRAVTLEVHATVASDGGSAAILLDRADAAAWPPGVYQFRFRLNGQTRAVTFAIFDARAG
jgi:hypothetical protein